MLGQDLDSAVRVANGASEGFENGVGERHEAA